MLTWHRWVCYCPRSSSWKVFCQTGIFIGVLWSMPVLISPFQRDTLWHLLCSHNDNPTSPIHITPHSPFPALFSSTVIITICLSMYSLYICLSSLELKSWPLFCQCLSSLFWWLKERPKLPPFWDFSLPPKLWLLHSFSWKWKSSSEMRQWMSHPWMSSEMRQGETQTEINWRIKI